MGASAKAGWSDPKASVGWERAGSFPGRVYIGGPPPADAGEVSSSCLTSGRHWVPRAKKGDHVSFHPQSLQDWRGVESVSLLPFQR